MAEPLVDIENLSFWHQQGGHSLQVLNEVSIHLDAGEVVVLTGASGSGKSTLLTIIGGLRGAEHGRVRSLNTELVNSTEKQRVELRRRIGFIFQQHHLAPALTVAQNIQMGLQHSGNHRSKDAKGRIETAAEQVGMLEHLDNYPNRLSGGQQQRAGIARALVNGPQLVLADEPTASLDKESGQAVLGLFDELAARGSAVVLVTHDKRILEQADRILMLEEGRIVPSVDRLLKDTSNSLRTLMHLDSKRLGRMLSFGHALARVALADGRLDGTERRAISEALEKREVFNGPEVELVVELALAQAQAWMETASDDTSRSQLAEALSAVAEADDIVTDEERQVIDELLAQSGSQRSE
jgi:putative ABC transport system ATP-binding protein